MQHRLLAAAIAALPFSLATPIAAGSEAVMPEVKVLGQTEGQTSLRQTPALADSAALLEWTPGVSTYSAGGVSSLPVIRGLADDRLRVKVDGMDLIAACPNHMNSPLSYTAPGTLESVTVYPGVTPVSVGGDSIGGTIVASSRKPVFAAPGQGTLVQGDAGTYYRSNGGAFGAHLNATYATEQLSLGYNGSMAESNNYKAGGDFKSFVATGRPGHSIAKDEVGSSAYKTRNHAISLALKSDNHLLEARISYQDIPYELYPNQRMDMLGNTQRAFNLRYLGQFDWGVLEARGYRETVDHYMDFGADKQFIYGGPLPAIVAPGMPMYTEGKTTGASVKADINLTPVDLLRLGGDYQQYRLNDWWPPSPADLTGMTQNGLVGGPAATYGGMAPLTFLNINDGQRDRLGIFGEWETRWNPQWKSQLGARLERVTTDAGPVHGYNTVYAGYVTSAAAFNAGDRKHSDNNLDLTATATYTPDAGSKFDFGYARKTRSPNLYERYSWSQNSMALIMNNFVGDGNGYLGNMDLKPEVAHTLSVTADWHDAERSWEFKFSPFYTRVGNYIDAVRCQGSGTMMNALCGGSANNTATQKFVQLQYANQAARLFGFDLSGRMPLGRTEWGQWGIVGLLNYTNGKNLDTDDDLYNIMPLNTKVALTHQVAGWNNSIELVAVKGKKDVADIRQEIPTGGYSLINLRASHSWQKVRLDFGVENLFDRLYQLPLGGAYAGQGMTMSTNGIPWGIVIPGAGRSLYTALNIKF